MYTSTYSSSPIQTRASGLGSTHYEHQSSDYPSNPPSYHSNMNSNYMTNDGSVTARRATGNSYSNAAPSRTSIPIQTETPSRTSINPSTAYSSHRSYDNGNQGYRPPSVHYDSNGRNVRAHSHDESLNNDPSRYPSSSMYNSSARESMNAHHENGQPYGRREQYRDDDELIVKSTDLSAVNEQEMLDLVRAAFRKYDANNQRELAGFLKRSADKAFATCWHCIVGRQFSSYVTHEMNGFIYLTKGQLSLLLFKSGS